MGARKLSRKLRHGYYVSRGEWFSAIPHLLLKCLDDRGGQIRTEDKIAQVLHEIAVTEDVITPRAVLLENLEPRQAVSAYVVGRVREELLACLRDCIHLQKGAHQFEHR